MEVRRSTSAAARVMGLGASTTRRHDDGSHRQQHTEARGRLEGHHLFKQQPRRSERREFTCQAGKGRKSHLYREEGHVTEEKPLEPQNTDGGKDEWTLI